MPDCEQITFGNVSTWDDLGLFLLGDYKLEPPSVKTNRVDIPGGDGSIDLSEFSGDVRYEDRQMEFHFLLDGGTPQEVEHEKTELMRLFHGQRTNFVLSFDPEYSYTGRVEITEFPYLGHQASATLEIIADPYKYKGVETWRINAAGGVEVIIPCGRRRWCPSFKVSRECLVTFNGKTWKIPAGTSKITELWLEPGDNRLILNTDPGYCATTWADYSSLTWAELAAEYPRWYQVAADSHPRQLPLTWSELDGTWAGYTDKRWIELVHPVDADDTYEAFIQTKIYEL